MTKSRLIYLAGTIWLLMGIFLLGLGIKFLLTILRNPVIVYFSPKFSLLKLFISTPYQTVILWTIIVSLAIGHLKGRWVFKRSVQRQVARIQALPTPRLRDLYSKGYYFLIAGMMGLGVLMRFLPITLEVRGAIDIVIGSALLQGALHYFRHPKVQ